MTTGNIYLTFNGNCREAMTFYKDSLGGDLFLRPIEGSPIEPMCPAAMKHQIMHSSITKGGFAMMASDLVGHDGYTQGTNFGISINCSSEEEVNTLFEKFSEGGKILDPIKVQFWGAIFGVVTDKFGIKWMFNYDKTMA